MRRGINLAGLRFGRLIVLGESHRDNGIVWRCLCDCGENHRAKTGHLRAGAVTSCGCAQEDAGRETGKKHGHKNAVHYLTHTPLHDCYSNMISRCYNPDSDRFGTYGARGISVCAEWRASRSVFYAWALSNGWKKGLTIDRKNNDGNYCPENCRWITRAEQQLNTTRSRFWNGTGKQ